MKQEIVGRRKLEGFLFLVGVICFAAIMLLIAAHNMQRSHEELMDRADYLIARSEASIARWNHGNR